MKRDLNNPSHWVFNRLAKEYQARPAYPDSLIEKLCSLLPGPQLADLGAGTGLLSIALAQRGYSVKAIEPSFAMRASLKEQTNIEAIEGTAEETSLENQSVQGVVAAEAAQWFMLDKAVSECRRILQKGGLVAAVEWLPTKAPYQKKLQELLRSYNPKTRGKTNQPAISWVQQTCTQTPKQQSFSCVIEWSMERFLQATRSFSYVGPALGPEKLKAFEDELRALLFDTYQSENFEEKREAILIWEFY
jgi:ubiquinone/menaquinone biosynthesis C-methylase UbiE